jgi:hypothetical protein
MIAFKCPFCRKLHEQADGIAGLLVRCHFCRNQFVVPGATNFGDAATTPYQPPQAAAPPPLDDPWKNIDVKKLVPPRRRMRAFIHWCIAFAVVAVIFLICIRPALEHARPSIEKARQSIDDKAKSSPHR